MRLLILIMGEDGEGLGGTVLIPLTDLSGFLGSEGNEGVLGLAMLRLKLTMEVVCLAMFVVSVQVVLVITLIFQLFPLFPLFQLFQLFILFILLTPFERFLLCSRLMNFIFLLFRVDQYRILALVLISFIFSLTFLGLFVIYFPFYVLSFPFYHVQYHPFFSSQFFHSCSIIP